MLPDYMQLNPDLEVNPAWLMDFFKDQINLPANEGMLL